MVGYKFGPPLLDFSPLGQLGDRYARGIKQRHEMDIAENRERALAGFGQNGDLAALGQTLLRAGDLEGGMSALRIAAANEGTPWQKQQAAREDQRYADAAAERQAERARQEANRQRDDARQDRLQPYTGTDEFKDPRQGLRDPVTGDIFWQDGTVTPGPKRGAPGPQSGGAGDPNLPAIGGITAQGGAVPLTDTGQPEYGYAIPGTGARYPHGTILPPKGDTATAVQAQPAPVVTPPRSDVPAVGAQQNQALPVAAPAGQVAVAAPPEPTVPAAPVTATQINQGTTNIAPMSNAEMIAEARRIGVSPAQYRQARAAAIQKEMEAKMGVGEKPTKEQADARAAAGKMEGAEREYRPNEGDTISVWERMKSAAAPGRSENFITSEKYQQGVAAKKEWIAGLLRKESGSAVTPDEFEYYNAIYFPEVGQGGVVAEQKARARQRALQGVKAGMSPNQIAGLDKVSDEPPPAPGQVGGAPPAAATPAAPQRKTSTGVGWSLW